MKTRTRVLAVLLAGASLLPAAAWADHDEKERQRVWQLRERGEILPLQTILEKALAERPGRVLEVEFDEEDGRYVYEVEVLSPDGEVWEIEINAATGEPLEVEKHNRR